VLVNAQDPLAEGLQRIKNILQTSGQLFGGTNRDSGNSNRRPLLFDGKKFLLQEQSVVCPANSTVASCDDATGKVKTTEVSSKFTQFNIISTIHYNIDPMSLMSYEVVM